MRSEVRQDKRQRLLPTDVARITEQAQQFIRMCYWWEKQVGQENHVRSLALYPPSTSRNGQWLVIAKAWSGGYKLVAFYRASDPLTAFVGFFGKWASGKLEWKEDKYND